MMKKIISLLLLYFSMQAVSAQEKCTSESIHSVDVNIVHKCLAEKKVESNNTEASVIVTTIPSRRHIRKRIYFEKVISFAEGIEAKSLKRINTLNELAECSLGNVYPIIKETTKKSISFDVVEEIPAFLSCKESLKEKEDCFNYKMQDHIMTTLVYPEEAIEKGLEGEVLVSFVINEMGKVTEVKTEGINVPEILKKEAKRIVLLLPDFIPGKQQSKNARVLYRFPMIFSLNSSDY